MPNNKKKKIPDNEEGFITKAVFNLPSKLIYVIGGSSLQIEKTGNHLSSLDKELTILKKNISKKDKHNI